jgi:predicted ATPase
MKLRINNLGPIKNGEIDLDKRLTVFVGYNNSGKTYVSNLLWSLFDQENKFYRESNLKINLKVDFDKLPFKIEISNHLIASIIDDYTKFLIDKGIPNTFYLSAESSLFNKFKIRFIDDFENSIKSKSFKAALILTDGSDSSEQFIFKKNKGSLNIEIDKGGGQFQGLSRGAEFQKFMKKHKLDSITFTHISKKGDFEDVMFYFNNLVRDLILRLAFDDNPAPFFLPANRLFYPSYYKYIYSAAKDEKDLISSTVNFEKDFSVIKALAKRPYTKSMDVLTKSIYNLNTKKEPINSYDDLLEELTELLGGDIEITSTEGIAPIDFQFKLKNKESIDMHIASSSVNQLTTFYLYLKYWTKASDNFLFIDEPEENLHPINQIKILKILMKFASRNNNKVLITTHSPLLTEAINNYVNLAYIKKYDLKISEENVSKQIDVEAFDLKPEDFGVYFFDGSHIKPYSIPEYGAFFKDFNEAEEKVKDTSNYLKGLIFDYHHQDKKNG